jgi:hypothetical protein
VHLLGGSVSQWGESVDQFNIEADVWVGASALAERPVTTTLFATICAPQKVVLCSRGTQLVLESNASRAFHASNEQTQPSSHLLLLTSTDKRHLQRHVMVWSEHSRWREAVLSHDILASCGGTVWWQGHTVRQRLTRLHRGAACCAAAGTIAGCGQTWTLKRLVGTKLTLRRTLELDTTRSAATGRCGGRFTRMGCCPSANRHRTSSHFSMMSLAETGSEVRRWRTRSKMHA